MALVRSAGCRGLVRPAPNLAKQGLRMASDRLMPVASRVRGAFSAASSRRTDIALGTSASYRNTSYASAAIARLLLTLRGWAPVDRGFRRER